MTESHSPTTYRCGLCCADFSSPVQMAFHVMKVERHRRMLSHFAPQQAKELARLQYFLDTHMKKEPILGLEYIMEEQLEPENYRYTCQLCHQGGDPYTTFIHIMSKWHMERYIEKHHPSLFVNNSNQPIEALYIRELRDTALAIQKEYGRKEMQRKQSEGNSPSKQKQVLPILVNKRPGYCHICNVFRSPTLIFFQHILGRRHRTMLWKIAPREVKKQARMQYILDIYLKEEPVVGLEYVVEEQLEPDNYGYTCQLCDVKGDLYMGLSHIFSREHMQCYIVKHHPAFLLIDSKRPIKAFSLRELRDKAFTIQKVYGRKEMQRKQSGGNGPAMLIRPRPTEEARPRPTEEARKSPTEEARPRPTEEARKSLPEDVNEASGPFLHDGEGLYNCRQCRLCDMVFPSPVDLWNHVVGSKHKELLSKTSPKELKELGRLQYFLNNHMKKDPLLGLEYIVEEQLDSTSYKYTCQLCNVEGDLPLMITHISCVDHVERYIDKDHSDLSLRIYTYPERADYIKALTIIAFIILDKCGRQDIDSKCT